MIAPGAVALAAGVAGAALATTSSASSATDAAASPTPPASGHWPRARGPMGGPFPSAPFHSGGFLAGPGGVIHGQVVVPSAGVAGTATVSGSTTSLTRIIDLSRLGGGRFAPSREHQPSAAG